ncbi:MAG TPA: RidA family protein [Rubrobacter sp.]|nr:RidA family protein [Rubrobacter sp.]
MCWVLPPGRGRGVAGRVYIRRGGTGAVNVFPRRGVSVARKGKKGNREPEAAGADARGAFSAGVEAPPGRTVYVSGQVAMDAEGAVVGEGDAKAQTEKVLQNVAAVLEEADGGLDDIVKVTVFITDMVHYDEVHEARRRHFGGPYPASSMVEVSALIDPRLLVEVEAVAVIP